MAYKGGFRFSKPTNSGIIAIKGSGEERKPVDKVTPTKGAAPTGKALPIKRTAKVEEVKEPVIKKQAVKAAPKKTKKPVSIENKVVKESKPATFKNKLLVETINIHKKVTTGELIPLTTAKNVLSVKLNGFPLEAKIDYFAQSGGIAICFNLSKSDVLEIYGE